MKREWQVKKWTKAKKEALISGNLNNQPFLPARQGGSTFFINSQPFDSSLRSSLMTIASYESNVVSEVEP
jgi:hypothetical protein